MSDFQKKTTIISCILLIIGLACSLASVIIPEWILDFDHTGLVGISFVKYGIFMRCTKKQDGPMECVMHWTSDIQPGEGDWITACRAMFILGMIAAIAGAVIAIVYVIVKLKIIGILVIGASIAAAVFSIIGIAIWVENWSKLVLRYVNNKARYGAGVWVMTVAIIFYVLACTITGAALLMKVRKNKDSSGRPAFERRDQTRGLKATSKF